MPAQKADLEDGDLVVGVLIGGKSRTYPVRLLNLHEVINDQLGEIKFAVTWCPLCFSPVVYNRTMEGQDLHFHASGFLFGNYLVLLDRPTNTPWCQLLGQGTFYISTLTEEALCVELVNNGRQIRDDQIWSLTSGIALKEELRDRQLLRYPSPPAYWYAWSGFYPKKLYFSEFIPDIAAILLSG